MFKQTLINGYLYCMTSSWMPVNTFKIGLTENLSNRLGQYATYHINPRFIITCPPLINPNDIFVKGKNEPKNSIDLIYYREDVVHKMLQPYRCVSNREFFECTLEQVKEAFSKVESMNELECIAYLSDVKLSSKSELDKYKEENILLKSTLESERLRLSELEEEIDNIKKERDEYKVLSTEKGAKYSAAQKYKELSDFCDKLKTESDNLKNENEKLSQVLNMLKKENESLNKENQELCQSKIELMYSVNLLKKQVEKLEKLEKAEVKVQKQSFSVMYYLSPKRDNTLPNKNKCEDVFNALFKKSVLLSKFSCEVESYKGERKVYIKGVIEVKTDDIKKEIKKCCKEIETIGNNCWSNFDAEFFLDENN